MSQSAPSLDFEVILTMELFLYKGKFYVKVYLSFSFPPTPKVVSLWELDLIFII